MRTPALSLVRALGFLLAAALLLPAAASAADSPLETLKRRYAAGELSAEQFAESKRLLEGGG